MLCLFCVCCRLELSMTNLREKLSVLWVVPGWCLEQTLSSCSHQVKISHAQMMIGKRYKPLPYKNIHSHWYQKGKLIRWSQIQEAFWLTKNAFRDAQLSHVLDFHLCSIITAGHFYNHVTKTMVLLGLGYSSFQEEAFTLLQKPTTHTKC